MLSLIKQILNRSRQTPDTVSPLPDSTNSRNPKAEVGVDLSTTLLDPRYEALCRSRQSAQRKSASNS